MANTPSNNNTSRPTSSSSYADHISPRQHPVNLFTTAVSSTTTTPLHTPRKESPSVSHRSSFAEGLRAHPSSPRMQRHNSISGSALTDLLMNAPTKTNGPDAAKFKDRDWRTIRVAEIIDPDETRFVELDTSIEDTTKLLIKSGAPNVVLIRESHATKTAIGWFGYDELNAYLLLVLGMSQPDEVAAKIRERARAGDTLLLREVNEHLGMREEPQMLAHTANLAQAMEMLGSGMHRIVITKEGTTEAVGVLSQLRLVRFFWENHQSFAVTERLYGVTLKELGIGAKDVLAINGDRPVSDALRLMHDEGITSLPVLDGQNNVVGNISHVDTRLLTDTSAIPLLSGTCIHFISVILSERGVENGQDSYPVFHVTPFNTLAHTVAKLCATRSHRMWIVDAPSPSNSVPPSPGVGHSYVPPFSMQHPASAPAPHRDSVSSTPPFTPLGSSLSISSMQPPGATISGHLTGVVSLTDVLNILARASGLSPGDPEATRRRRRRSSSSSLSRSRTDTGRPSADIIRGSMDGGRRSGSATGLGRR